MDKKYNMSLFHKKAVIVGKSLWYQRSKVLRDALFREIISFVINPIAHSTEA